MENKKAQPMRSKKYFLLVLLVPVAILLSLTFKPLVATHYGVEVTLRTEPYDPRDLLYGDYEDLNFEAESVPVKLFDSHLKKHFKITKQDDDEYAQYLGKSLRIAEPTVYLTLGKNNGIDEVVSVHEEEPSSGVYLKGTLLTSSYRDGKVRIELPLDRYYVEENTGKVLEEQSRKGKLLAKVGVYHGYPIIKSVSVENK
ncbi:GDYXXLXY domain-containing protein [Neobacillus sp. PS3-34]|uniref:GDYXXLXY domain-containing protein n=1 Tax=Neobacillus sp. PS3-34 TaxID=3070678 RepID=UPI0027DFA407|nr:GDYXXLXY domain-containing protein [Neobacillus sp. PS3-34]WML46639.1 GDYXXLXY domain-containing protein [Neobacillus sp. PS3-34]